MATSSIFESIKITDPKVAEAFVHAIELSEADQKKDNEKPIEIKMSTREDIMRRYHKDKYIHQ